MKQNNSLTHKIFAGLTILFCVGKLAAQPMASVLSTFHGNNAGTVIMTAATSNADAMLCVGFFDGKAILPVKADCSRSYNTGGSESAMRRIETRIGSVSSNQLTNA